MLRLRRTSGTKIGRGERITIFPDIQDWFLVEGLLTRFKVAWIYDKDGFYMGHLDHYGMLSIIPDESKNGKLVSTDRNFNYDIPEDLKKAVQCAWLMLQKPAEVQV